MKIAFLAVFFTVGVTATAYARLGETADQLVTRYGQPLSETDQKREGTKIPLSYVIFQKGGFEVDVTISDGLSVLESFKKLNGASLTLSEIRTLLNVNAQGFGWAAPRTVQGKKRWLRDDGATAELPPDNSILTIRSKELMAKEEAAKTLQSAPTLDGF